MTFTTLILLVFMSMSNFLFFIFSSTYYLFIYYLFIRLSVSSIQFFIMHLLIYVVSYLLL